MAITKQDLICAVSNDTGLPMKEVKAVLEASFERIIKAVDKRETVIIRRFGKFHKVNFKAKVGHHFQNNKSIDIPARWVVKFAPSAEFTKIVNRSSP